MSEASLADRLNLSDRSVAVALIVLTRYLASRDADLSRHLVEALRHAQASNLLDADLSALRLIIGAIGE